MSCNREPISQADIWACDNEMQWDSLSTHQALIGEWEWEYISCFSDPEELNHDEYNGMTIEFSDNNILQVREDGQLVQISTWELELEDGSLFGIHAVPRVIQLYGRILICDDRVKFNDSYRDGCDNFFKR